MTITEVSYELTNRKHGRITVVFWPRPEKGTAKVSIYGRGHEALSWRQKSEGSATGNFRPNMTAARYWARLFLKETA